MAKSDDILKKYGITQTRGSEEKSSTNEKSTTSSNAKGTGINKADNILAKYGIIPAKGGVSSTGNGSTIAGYNDNDAISGWNKYLAEKRKKKEEEEEKSWLEKIAGWLGQSSDTTLPGANITTVTNAYREDTSYREPSDNWSISQKNDFGYLYNQNPEQAWKYAEDLNNSIAKAEKEKQEAAVKASATDGFWKSAAHTAGAIATAPLGLADYLDNMAEYTARGKVTEKAGMTPFDYSQTVTSSIANDLNGVDMFGVAHNVLPENIPIIGGKGWGDVYGLGTSIAQSALAGYTGGQIGTLVQFFGSAAASGFDEAKRRGATDEQALKLGTLSGAAEGLAEMIGVDNLLKIGSASTMKQLLKNIVKQGAAEGIEEGVTSLMNNFADQIVMKDKSNFYTMVRQLMDSGLSEEEAKKKAWKSMANDLAFDMVAGFVSGTVHAGPQTAYQTAMENIYQPYQTGKYIMESEGSVDALKQLADEVAGVSSADMQQAISEQTGKVNDKQSALNVGRLYETVQKANNLANASANQADIAKSLQRKGFTAQEAKAVAEALVAKYNGQELTKAQKKTLASVKGNTAVKDAISNIMTNTKSTMGQRSDNIRNFQKDVSIGMIAKANGMSADEVKKIAEGNLTTMNENGSESHYEVSVDGKTLDGDGNIVTIKGIASIKNGRMVLETETGTVDAKDVSYASKGEAMVYEAVAKLEDIIDTETANKLSKHLLKLGGASSEVYVNAIEQAYTYGYYGYGRDQMLGENTLSATLTEKQRNVAYGLGEQYRNARTAVEQALVREAQSNMKSSVSGKVHFNGDRNALTERQSASLSAMETVAEALGVQIHVFESQVDERGKRIGANGWYDPKDNSIHIDLHAGAKGEGVMLFTASHELTHHIRKWSPDKFKALADFLMQEYGKKGVNVDALVRAQMEKAKRTRDYDMSYDEAYEEVIADSMESMLSDGKVMEKLAKLKQVDKSLWQKVKDFISELADKIRKVYEGMAPDSVEGCYVAEMVDSIEKLQELFTEALVDASENYQFSLTPGQEGTIVNQNGDPVAHATADGTIQLSMRTYEEEGREAFRKYLQKCVSSKKITKAEMQEMLDGIEEIYGICKDFKDKYAPFSSWSDAAVVRDTHGKPVFSVVTPNGDYKMNLDFSLVCKKRRTLDAVFNEMSRRGIIDDFELGQKSVVKINEIIRKYDLETACALCFVDAKRFRQASMADQFTRLYNELVESLVPEDQRGSIDHFNFSGYSTIKKVEGGIDTWANSKLDFSHINHVLKTYGDGTVEYKAAKYIKTHAEGRKLLLRGDFMSSQGFDAVKTQNQDILKLYNSKKGTGGPKAAFGDVQYLNEIIQKARWWTPAKAYEVGGVRIQSFSDYVPRMVFDYVQMIYDLAATKLPAHAYTKEALFVKQFGLTGVKINMSLIPAIAEGGIAPGLDANGNYVWAGESFDFETAKQIQNAEGYSENCGTICVGVSDRHIRKLLSDPDIRMVIPYHKSGLNPIVAHMNKIAEFTDYTNKQNTTVKETGAKAEKHFDFNKALHDMGENADPRAVIQQYFDWCDDNGYEPKFAEFRDHPNYYKLIEDFTLYDKDGKYVPQREVRAVFPKKTDAFGSMKDLIKEGLEEDAVVEGKRDKALNKIVDEIQNTLPRTEAEIPEEQVTQADRDLEALKLSARDNAPTFYSHMARVVDGVKQEKLGAASVVSMLRGKGVKAEEIKWSGIEAWLEGKKSVTKAELQEFIAGSMLQIEEETLTDKEMPYSQEHLDQIAQYEAERDIIAENLKSEWKRIVGTDIPIRNFGAGLESAVVNNLLEANATKKGETEAGYKYKAAMAALKRCIEYNDDYFGFDNERQAFREAVRNPKDFMDSYEMTSFEKGVFRDFIKAKEAYSKVEGIPMQDQKALKAIAESADRFNRRISQIKSEHRAKAAKHLTKWGQYKLRGGENYREILFKIPGSSYYNPSMAMHWDERDGVLAHARIQDLNTFLGKMLFIEEIQSDWHNDGRKDGYASEEQAVRKKVKDLQKQWDSLMEESMTASATRSYAINEKLDAIDEERSRLQNKLRDGMLAPDAPFSDNYHEYVLKRLLRMAAEQDYDSIGWTTAQIQSDRWSDEFAEGYRIEYDQDIPKFLNKYGKKWGTRVGKTMLDNGTEVWSMAITDEMKESVLKEGQPLYSDRDTDSVSNRSLLANALEGVAQNDIERQRLQEYKGKIDLINAEERKLMKLNEQIKELSFAKGPKDTKAIRDLQFEANQTANRISTYDKQLLRLEASKPLQDVLTREKKMAYQRAEKKGKEALEKHREKSAKTQRELITKYQDARKRGIESREKTAMRHKIKDVVNELNQYLLNGNKDKRVMMGLKKAVAEALDAVNMDTVGAEERIAKLEAELLKAKTPEAIQEISRKIDHVREMGDKMSNRLKALKDAYREIAESDDPLIANAHDDVIEAKLESVIEKVGNTPLRDMNISQLEDVYDMYRMVLTTIRNSNKAFKAAKSESIAILGNRVMEEIDKVGGKRKYNLAALEAIKKFGWNNLKPVYAFQHIGSDTFTEVFNNVRSGEDVWAVDVTEAREFYLDKSKKYKYDSWNFDKRYTFTSSSGMNFSLNLEQIMSLYAYSKRDQAADHLQRGGIVIDESTEITMKTKLGFKAKFNPTEATAYNISQETLGEITGKLTEAQKQFVDEMQDYLSTVMGAKGNEVSLELYGIKLFKEKFYFPLKSASQFMAKAKEQQQGEVKIKNSGFSKETVKKASNPIVLTPFMNVWAGHVNEMSMYHAFVLPMEDFYRVWSYRTPTSDTMATESVEMFIQNAYGKGATKYIDQLLKDLNGGARTDSTTGFINKMMGKFKKGAVFASLSVVVQQPSAIARAAAIVDTKYFIGPKVNRKRHKLLWNEVKQYAPVAIIKEMGYFDTNMGKSTQDFILGKEYSGIGDKMKALFTDSGYRDEILSKAPALADEMAWCSIWEAVKRETKAKNKGMDVKSEAFLKKAGERFTEVITKTQVYDSVLSRSANMRSKDTGMKMATAFMAEPTTSINMIADALLQGKRGNKKYARGAIGAVIASQILNSILVSFVYAGRDDDEDETYWEKYIGTLSGEILDSLNPAGYIPFVKDIQSIVQGYDVERSDMAVVSDLWNAYKKLGNENLSIYRKVEGFAGSIAQIFGLPVKNIMRDVRGIYQTINSFVNGQLTTKAGIDYAIKASIPEWLGGGEVSNKEQLYEATLSGDKDHLARVMSRYEDQDAVNSAMRSAIKEHYIAGDIRTDTAISYLAKYAGMEEDDAYWKVEEWEYENSTGEDFSKYNEFFTAVETGKNLKAVIKQYTDNGVEQKTLASQITSHFKPLYIEMTKAERANIKGYLINAMVVLGDSREEAEEDIAKWQYEADYPELSDRITYTQYQRWQADGKPNGVSLELYTDVAEYRDDGTSSSAKSQEDVAAYINSLPISTAQKDALWCCFWKESTLKKAPWH